MKDMMGNRNFTKEEYHQRFGLTVERGKNDESLDRSSCIPLLLIGTWKLREALSKARRSRIYKQVENGVYIRLPS